MNPYIQLIIRKLKDGQHVLHREGGNSMSPKIRHKEAVILEPVTDENLLEKDDVVFCNVGFHCTHKIKAIKLVKGKRRYQISNLKGEVNKEISADKIYGRVIVIGENACKEYMEKSN